MFICDIAVLIPMIWFTEFRDDGDDENHAYDKMIYLENEVEGVMGCMASL